MSECEITSLASISFHVRLLKAMLICHQCGTRPGGGDAEE